MGPGASLALGAKAVKSIEDLPWQVAVLDPQQYLCQSIPWLELSEQALSLLFDIIYCYPTGFPSLCPLGNRVELTRIGGLQAPNGNGCTKPPSGAPCTEQRGRLTASMTCQHLKCWMMDECHPAGKGKGGREYGGLGGARRGGNPAQRSQGRRAGTRVDVRTDPHPWVVIHGERRGLSSCPRAPPLSARWIEILLLLAALLYCLFILVIPFNYFLSNYCNEDIQ